MGHGTSPGSGAKGEKPPHLQAKGGAGVPCQMPKDSSLLQVSTQGSSPSGWGGGAARLGASITSLGCWLGSLKPSPPVTVVTNY